MSTMNYEMLNEVRKMYKKSYVPPPSPQQPPMGGQPPMPSQGVPMGGQPPMPSQGAPMEAQQVQQIIQQELQAGKPMEEIVGTLLQMGVPQELLQQILQPQAEAPATSEPAEEPKRLEDIMNERVEEERKKRKEKMLTPEERMDVIENKLATLTEVIQELVDSSAQKQASYEQYTLASQEIMDNSL